MDAIGGVTAESPCRHKFCPDSGMLPGVGLETRATRTVLQMLLRPLATLCFVGGSAFVLRELWVDPAGLHGVFYVTTAVVGAMTAWLYLDRELSVAKLRVVELSLFSVLAVQGAVLGHDRLLAGAATGDPGIVMAYLGLTLMEFILIMAAYALFIPNSGLRAALVLVPLALMTPLIWVVVTARSPEVATLAAPVMSFRAVSDLVMFGVMATAMCVMGTMLITRYRSMAVEAKSATLYDLREQIGKGGMGEVWLAEHRTLARPAAIKIVRPDLLADGDKAAGTQAVKRFAREAQATAALRSPHTVEIYDFGVTEEGTFYYVMEYLDGLDLGTLVKRHGPLPTARAVHLLRQACASLEDAHRHSLVHRDIKPANVFACRLGTEYDFAKVLDFGLVKDQRPTENTQLTVDGLTTGTPAYMAPEMALQDGRVGPATDIYALGCVAYWLLTGKLVFDEPTPVAMIVNHVKTVPDAPSTRTELPIPAELDKVVLRCLEKEPADRYSSMRELSAALAALQLDNVWDSDRAEEWWQIHQPLVEPLELAQAS